MVSFDAAHAAVHYPKDCRFRIWVRLSILIACVIAAGESRIVSPQTAKWNGPMVLFWLHLASTIPSNAAPEAGLRARVAPATVNTRFNSGVLTCTFWSLPWGCSCGCQVGDETVSAPQNRKCDLCCGHHVHRSRGT